AAARDRPRHDPGLPERGRTRTAHARGRCGGVGDTRGAHSLPGGVPSAPGTVRRAPGRGTGVRGRGWAVRAWIGRIVVPATAGAPVSGSALSCALAPVSALAFALAVASTGCGADNAGRNAIATDRTPRQVIVIVDLSGSRAAHMLDEGRKFLEEVIAGLDFGDRLVLLEMHQRSPVDDVRRWADSIPLPPDPSFIT